MKRILVFFCLIFSFISQAQVESISDYIDDDYKVLRYIGHISSFSFGDDPKCYDIDTNWNPIQEIIEMSYNVDENGVVKDSSICYRYILNEQGCILEKQYVFKRNQFITEHYQYSEDDIDTIQTNPFLGQGWILSPNDHFFSEHVYSNCVQRDSCGKIQYIEVNFNNGRSPEKLKFTYDTKCIKDFYSWRGPLLLKVEYYQNNVLIRFNRIKYVMNNEG